MNVLSKDTYNCRNKNNCPLDGKCINPNIISEAKITSKQPNYKEKIHIGTTETDFKHKFNNQIKCFNLEKYENDTALYWTIYWTIKRSHFTPKITWRIRKYTPYNATKRK